MKLFEINLNLFFKMSSDQEKAEKLKAIKFNMYKAMKITMSNVELALSREDNTDEKNQELNSQLQNIKEKMKNFTPEEIADFDKMLKK